MLFIHTSENPISEISCHYEIENNIGFKSFGGNRINKITLMVVEEIPTCM